MLRRQQPVKVDPYASLHKETAQPDDCAVFHRKPERLAAFADKP